jgi:MFS family permease
MVNKDVLWSKNFIIACVANFLTACSFNLLMPTIPLYLTEVLNIEGSKIGIILSSYAFALLLIRPFSGFLVDLYPRKILYLIGITCFMAIFFGYYFAVTVSFFIILRFVHGLFWGLSSVSANTVAIDIIPTSRRAEGIGYFGVNMNIAMAIAPFFAI